MHYIVHYIIHERAEGRAAEDHLPRASRRQAEVTGWSRRGGRGGRGGRGDTQGVGWNGRGGGVGELRTCRQAEGESECDMRWKALEPTILQSMKMEKTRPCPICMPEGQTDTWKTRRDVPGGTDTCSPTAPKARLRGPTGTDLHAGARGAPLERGRPHEHEHVERRLVQRVDETQREERICITWRIT